MKTLSADFNIADMAYMPAVGYIRLLRNKTDEYYKFNSVT